MLHRFTDDATTDNTYNPVAYTYNAIGNILPKVVGSTSYAYTYEPTRRTDITLVDRGTLWLCYDNS